MPDKELPDSTVSGRDFPDLTEEIADLFALSLERELKDKLNPSKHVHEKEGKNQRGHYRHPVHWRLAIVNKSHGKNDIYHGSTLDVSMSGISILLERNVFFSTSVVILLEIPPMNQGQKKSIVETQCSLVYSVLDSVHSQFRLAMKFDHFKGDGQRILTNVLSERPIPKNEPIGDTAKNLLPMY